MKIQPISVTQIWKWIMDKTKYLEDKIHPIWGCTEERKLSLNGPIILIRTSIVLQDNDNSSMWTAKLTFFKQEEKIFETQFHNVDIDDLRIEIEDYVLYVSDIIKDFLNKIVKNLLSA